MQFDTFTYFQFITHSVTLPRFSPSSPLHSQCITMGVSGSIFWSECKNIKNRIGNHPPILAYTSSILVITDMLPQSTDHKGL
jgi:hypothetical protein